MKLNRRNKSNKLVIPILVLSLLFISIGYSYLQTTLSINGEVSFDERLAVKKTKILGNDFFYNIDNVASEFVSSSTGINFNASSSNTNGKGLYLRAGTENDEYPIYYFRGGDDQDGDGVEDYLNNHVLFGGFCWRIVRTTELGGTKLIYNGSSRKYTTEPLEKGEYINLENDDNYAYKFNEEKKQWGSTNHEVSDSLIKFSVPESGEYVIDYSINSFDFESGSIYIYVNDIAKVDGVYHKSSSQIYLGNLSSSDKIEVRYTKLITYSFDDTSDNITFSVGKVTGPRLSCDNTGIESQLNTTSYFNTKYTLADVGYMYGTRYQSVDWKDTDYMYGSDVAYSNGVYTLIDTTTGKISNIQSKHYTCRTDAKTCSIVYYVYYLGKSSNSVTSIELSNGKKVDDVIEESFANEHSSAVKTIIDNWFKNSLTNEVDSNKKDYKNYLEDAVWCNDRSLVNGGGYFKNGNVTQYTYFGGYIRAHSLGKPELKDDIACPYQRDRFTLKSEKISNSSQNGNQLLDYAVGLITADEANAAGVTNSSESNQTPYLFTGQLYLTMTPYSSTPYTFGLGNDHFFWGINASFPIGVRPSVVLKKDIIATSGDGSSEHPFVVE